jgi:hypothetical protein
VRNEAFRNASNATAWKLLTIKIGPLGISAFEIYVFLELMSLL